MSHIGAFFKHLRYNNCKRKALDKRYMNKLLKLNELSLIFSTNRFERIDFFVILCYDKINIL